MWVLIERNHSLLNINTGARFRVALEYSNFAEFDASVIYEGPVAEQTEDYTSQVLETLYRGTEEECLRYIIEVLQPQISNAFLPSVQGTSRKELQRQEEAEARALGEYEGLDSPMGLRSREAHSTLYDDIPF